MERSGTASASADGVVNVLEIIPQEYLLDPYFVEPILHFLPKMIANSAASGGSKASASPGGGSAGAGSAGSGGQAATKFPNLRVLLAAAEDDIRLHRARKQAGLNDDVSLLRTYKIEGDSAWLERQQRLNERDLMLSKLETERAMILKELASDTKGLTAQEKTQVQLARWQRALELYVYTSVDDQQRNKHWKGAKNLDFLELLEKLLEGIAEVSRTPSLSVLGANFCLNVRAGVRVTLTGQDKVSLSPSMSFPL